MAAEIVDRLESSVRSYCRSFTTIFSRAGIIETAGARDQVLKLLPALTIDDGALDAGLDIRDAAALAACEAAP
jgi:4-aminobutyrate aminotransferase-like enzyme